MAPFHRFPLSLALSFHAYPKDGQEVTFKKTAQTPRKCELKTVFICIEHSFKYFTEP